MNGDALHYLTFLATGTMPAVMLLALLVAMDSYKLIKTTMILAAIGWGMATALMCMLLNETLLEITGLSFAAYSGLVGPMIEEVSKAAYPTYMVKRGRVGFPVDAAILGFSLGAGFAIVENIYYLYVLPGAPAFVWLVRGFGTAIMHGTTASIFTVLARVALDKRGSFSPAALLPGLLLATAIHMLFNRFLLSPPVTTAVLLVGIPSIMVLLYGRSESSLRRWLGTGFDADAELLETIVAGGMSDTKVGRYLAKIEEGFPGEVVADMVCYLRLNLELSMRAKGMLLAREAGFTVPGGPDVEEKLMELSYLSRSLGRTGRLAMAPLLRRSAKELWQIYMLEGKARNGG